jgi:hypothetical protein
MIYEKIDSRFTNISNNFDERNNTSDLNFYQVIRATHNKWLLFLKFLINMRINIRLIVKIIINIISMSQIQLKVDISGQVPIDSR